MCADIYKNEVLTNLVWWLSLLNCTVLKHSQWPWPSSRKCGCRKVTPASIVSRRSWLIWVKCAMLLGLSALMNLILTESYPINVNRKKILRLVKQTIKKHKMYTGLPSDIYVPIFFKHDITIDIELYSLKPVSMTFICTEGHSCMRKWKLAFSSRNILYQFGWNLICCHMLCWSHTNFGLLD